jgi:hypothetical protein
LDLVLVYPCLDGKRYPTLRPGVVFCLRKYLLFSIFIPLHKLQVGWRLVFIPLEGLLFMQALIVIWVIPQYQRSIDLLLYIVELSQKS